MCVVIVKTIDRVLFPEQELYKCYNCCGEFETIYEVDVKMDLCESCREVVSHSEYPDLRERAYERGWMTEKDIEWCRGIPEYLKIIRQEAKVRLEKLHEKQAKCDHEFVFNFKWDLFIEVESSAYQWKCIHCDKREYRDYE